VKVWLCLPVLLLTACSTTAHKPIKITFAEAYSPTAFKDYSFVKVCGYATNTFENSQISETRTADWRDKNSGLGVKWLDSADDIKTPEKRCVRGFLEPTCGWGDLPDDLDSYEAPVCISTATTYQWSIRQEFLADD